MILTCPECGTQYVVKDGAIPAAGRQVRCANCRHSWHQDPEPLDLAEPEAEAEELPTVDEAPTDEEQPVPASWSEEAVDDAAHATADDDQGPVEADDETASHPGYSIPPEGPRDTDEAEFVPVEDDPIDPEASVGEPVVAERWTPPAAGRDDDFSPFAERQPVERQGRGPLSKILVAIVLIAALAAAFWFLAPPSWKERVGLAGIGATPLQLMMTHSDRQTLASGNELLQVSGRVINPTDDNQPVPPIYAQLKDSTGKLIYTWTIAPPARNLPPRASATFNSAEVNVPAGGDELTITLGSKA